MVKAIISIVSNYKLKAGYALLVLILMFAAATILPSPVRAASDCDSNAVIYCGVTSVKSLQSDYYKGDGKNSAKSIQNIYSWFGISGSDINNLGSKQQSGSVTSDGKVYIGTKLVATNGLTGGRQNIAGSSKQTYNGTVFYTRPPAISFKSNRLEAYVVMHNGVFQYAILTSCGNPVIGTGSTTPAATVKPAPTPAPSTKALVNTGPGDWLLPAAGAFVIGTLFYQLLLRRLFRYR